MAQCFIFHWEPLPSGNAARNIRRRELSGPGIVRVSAHRRKHAMAAEALPLSGCAYSRRFFCLPSV